MPYHRGNARYKNNLNTNNNLSRKPPKERINLRPYQLQCDECDYRTSHKNLLQYHIKHHTNQGMSCHQCSYSTINPSSFRRHLLKHRVREKSGEGLPQLKCNECAYVTISKNNLRSHITRKHATKKKFKCDTCDFATAYHSSFVKHKKSHEKRMKVNDENVTYKCDKCSFVTKHEGFINRHLVQKHKEITPMANKCDFCEFRTKLKLRLQVHKSRNRQKTPIKCEICDFVTDYNCAYKLHKSVKHLAEVGTVVETDYFIRSEDPISKTEYTVPQPPIDGEQFFLDADKVEIEWQSIEVLENPGQERQFQCTACEYTSNFKATIQRHFQRHHTSDDNLPYKCLHCDFSTKTREQIAGHIKRSQSSTIVQCSKCNFSTYFKCQNVIHQKCHYPFKCKLCSYVCKHHYEIQGHYTKVHLGTGLKCQYCNFVTARRDRLARHEGTHAGVKAYKCEQCDCSYTVLSYLQNHMKKKHDSKTCN